MNQRRISLSSGSSVLCGLLIYLAASPPAPAEPAPQAVTAFNAYVTAVEGRLAQQHRSQIAFLSPLRPDLRSEQPLQSDEPIIEHVAPTQRVDLPGALLHHWRGTAFVPGGKAADCERLLRDFDAYPRHFSPQVLEAKIIAQRAGSIQASMRVRQKRVFAVVMDTTYDVTFSQLDAQHRYSASRSTRIVEIEAAGTAKERALSGHDEHGFLWRLNTYWTYEERDGGLYIQIESVSLSRSI